MQVIIAVSNHVRLVVLQLYATPQEGSDCRNVSLGHFSAEAFRKPDIQQGPNLKIITFSTINDRLVLIFEGKQVKMG